MSTKDQTRANTPKGPAGLMPQGSRTPGMYKTSSGYSIVRNDGTEMQFSFSGNLIRDTALERRVQEARAPQPARSEGTQTANVPMPPQRPASIPALAARPDALPADPSSWFGGTGPSNARAFAATAAQPRAAEVARPDFNAAFAAFPAQPSMPAPQQDVLAAAFRAFEQPRGPRRINEAFAPTNAIDRDPLAIGITPQPQQFPSIPAGVFENPIEMPVSVLGSTLAQPLQTRSVQPATPATPTAQPKLVFGAAGQPAAPRQAQPATRTVQRGDTLWGISQQEKVAFPALLGANKQFKNPDRIFPGNTVNIPGRSAPTSNPLGSAKSSTGTTGTKTVASGGKSPSSGGGSPSGVSKGAQSAAKSTSAAAGVSNPSGKSSLSGIGGAASKGAQAAKSASKPSPSGKASQASKNGF